MVDPNLFHPGTGGTPEPALKVCRRCPVERECLDEAIEEEAGRAGGPFGVRGGLAAKERAPLVRARKKAIGKRESAELQRIRKLAAAGMKPAQIGAALGMDPEAVGSRLRRAAKRETKAQAEPVGGER
jgi:DNA-directed RNA polymerase specialized sigma24 family protein